MSPRTACLVSLVFAMSGMALAQAEPELISAGLPKYPVVAVTAHAEGVVKLSFTLPGNGVEPTKVAIVSGSPLFNTAVLENVKTWRFVNPYTVDRKYETTFTFRFSGKTVPVGPRKLTVSFESFEKVEVVTDGVESPVLDKNY